MREIERGTEEETWGGGGGMYLLMCRLIEVRKVLS